MRKYQIGLTCHPTWLPSSMLVESKEPSSCFTKVIVEDLRIGRFSYSIIMVIVADSDH